MAANLSNEFYELQFLIAVGAAFSEILFHILVSRYWIKKGTVVSTLVAYFLGFVILCFLEFFYPSARVYGVEQVVTFLLINFILYSGIAFMYFCFVNIGECSVRIRVLRELFAVKGGLTRVELLEKYNVDHVIGVRIERMLRSGEMIFKDGRYYFSGGSKMLLVAKASQKLKKLMLGKQSFERLK